MGLFFNKERFGVDPMTQEAVDQFAALPAPIMEGRKGGGFGEVLKALAGGVLDGVATHYGAEPGYSGARAARERALAAMAERQAALQDYEAKRQIDQSYEGPPESPAIVKNTKGFMAMSEEERRAFAEMQRLMNPPEDRVVISDGMLVSVPGTMPQGGGRASGPSQAHIQALQQNPERAADFDAKFGQGAAARYLGGGASNGTGGFPY